MFLKPFKKALSLFVALVFVLSLVPTVGMAEEKTDIIPISDLANTRASKANDTGVVAWSGQDTIKLQCDEANNANHWRAYGKFNLSGYEEILANEDTEIVFEMTLGGHMGSHSQTDILIYLMNDSCDGFTKESITFNKAAELGLHDLDKNGVKIGDVYRDDDTQYTRADVYSLKIPATTILNTLKQGKDDSVITFAFYTDNADGDSGKLAFFRGNTAKITIKYDDSKIDNKAYAKEIADGIKWSDLSNEELNSVTQKLNLPAKLYGANVTWSSDNNAIASDGTVNQTYENQDVVLTASVSYKGETATAEFTPTVKKKTYTYTNLFTGETTFKNLTSSVQSSLRIDTSVAGHSGKKSGDIIYNVHDLSGDSNYINYDVDIANPQLNNDVMEFSICIPSNSPGVQFTATILKPDIITSGNGSAQLTLDYMINTDGIYFGGKKIYDIKPYEWYNIAYVAPKGMATPGTASPDDDKTGKFYVNGELIHAVTCLSPTAYGVRTIQFRSYDSSMTDTGYYLDNLRIYSGDYIPSMDKLPEVKTSYVMENNIIKVPGNISVKQLKESMIKDEDTDIRVYASKTNTANTLSDDAILSSGNVLVTASTNGTNIEKAFGYYTIEKLDLSIEANIFADGVPSGIFSKESKVTAEVKFNNFCAEKQDVKMYVAQYKGGELINLWQDDEIVSSGENKVLSPDMSTFKAEEGSTIKLMLLYGTSLKPYIKPLTASYREEGDVPVLYLLGDSIVQEYNDETSPIQGWGKYIGSYLDNSRIKVDNRARSGWSTDHYLYPDGKYTKEDGLYEVGTELKTTDDVSKTVGEADRNKIWANVLSEIKPGDFVMISLGINDSGTANVPGDRYIENLTAIYNDATSKGASVILSTPTISGRNWNDGYSFVESYLECGELCEAFAKTNDSVCLPLGSTLVKTYNTTALNYFEKNNVSYPEALNYTRSLYHLYKENIKLPAEEGGFGMSDYSKDDDSLHLNERGADRIAKIIAELMKNSKSDIHYYVK
jgi:lysophospholipase L1-like esterase